MEKIDRLQWIAEIDGKGTCPKCHARLESDGGMGGSLLKGETWYWSCPACGEEYTVTVPEQGEKSLKVASLDEDPNFAVKFFDALSKDKCPECGAELVCFYENEGNAMSGLLTTMCRLCGFAIRGRGDLYSEGLPPAGVAEGMNSQA